MKKKTNFLIVFLMLFSIGSVFAQSKTVRNVGVGQTYTTIKAAIGAANDGDIINIVDAVHHEDPILIAKDITIQGQGASSTTIEGGYVSSTNHGATVYGGGIFVVLQGNTVTIQDLTLTKGAAENGTDRGTSDYGMSGTDGTGGGAIRNYNSVITIKRCVFTENYAGNGGNGAGGKDGADGANATSTSSSELGEMGGTGGDGGNGGSGGAIFNTLGGTIYIEDCLFTDNYAGQGGVAGPGGNGGRGGDGAGYNSYDDGADGGHAGNGGDGGDGGDGGAICNDDGTITVENCTFYLNSAGRFGDGRYGGNGGYGGSGPYSTGLNGNGGSGGFGGYGGDYGRSGQGGAIANVNNSTMECVNITISECYSKFDDITSNTVDGGRGGRGGSGNYGGYGGQGGDGGHAPECGTGGGIYNASTESIKIINSIVADNEVQFFTKVGGHGGLGGNGGIGNYPGIAGDQGAAGAGNSANTSHDVYGSFASEGYNIIKNRTGGSGWVTNDLSSGTNPNLQTLANNGGSTQTMAILETSPANNAGAASNATLTVPTTDQRGTNRQNSFGHVDIGAYEFVDPQSITASPTSLDFGSVEVGSYLVKEYTIVGHNVTNTNVYVSSPISQYYVSKDNGVNYGTYVIIHPTNGEINQTIKVRFKPTSTVTYSTNITNNGSGVCDVSVTGVGVTDPELSVSPTSLDFGTVDIGSSSTKSYTLTGSNLTNNVTVTAPSSYYKVSLSSGSGFASSINVTPSGGSVNKTIYVKFTPTSTSTVSGNVTNVSSGATSKNVAVTGNGQYAPSLSVSPTSLAYGTIDIGTSDIKSYVVTGSHLTENVSISVAQPYTLSTTSGGTYTSSLSIPQSGGSVNKTIYVKFTPTSDASPTRYIKNQSSGKTKFVTATGNGQYVPTISVSPTSLDFGSVNVGSSLTKNYTLTGSHLTNNVTVTALTGYQVSLSSSSGFVSSINLTPSSGSVNETIYVKFTPTASADYNGNVTNVSTDATTKNVVVTGKGLQPTLTTSVSELNFGDLMYGASSSEMSFVLTGSDIEGDVTIVDETILSDYGFEISKTSGSGFGTSITISPDVNGDISQTLYVRATANHTGTNVTSDPEFYYGSTASVIIDFKYNGKTEIEINPISLDFGNVNIGSSKKMSYTVNCEHLDGIQGDKSLFIYAPSSSEYKISKTENGTYGGLVVFNPTSGTVNETIWIQFTPTATGVVLDSAQHTVGYADDKYLTVTGTGVEPELSLSVNSLHFGDITVGNSSKLSLTVTGSNLTGTVTAESPSDEFLFCLTENGTYALTVDITPTSGSVNQILYVKATPTESGDYDDGLNVYCTSDGLNESLNVDYTGIVDISVAPTSLSFGDVQVDNSSSMQSFLITGANLASGESVTITAPTGFKVSIGTTYTQSIVLTENSGEFDDDINVKFMPTSAGSYSGNIVISGTHIVTKNVAVTGTGVEPVITTTPTTLSFGNVVTGQTAEQSYTLTGSNLVDDITVTAPAGYEVSLSSGSGFASSVVATQISGSVNTTIYVKFAPTAEQAYNDAVSNESTDATTKYVAVTGTGVAPATPIITTSLSSIDFGNVQTGSDSIKTFTIEGSDLTEDITIVVAGSNFETSTDGTTFGTSNIVLSQTSGTVAQKTIYVKFSPDAVQTYIGSVTNSSTGASQVVIGLSGNGITPAISVTPTTLAFNNVEVGSSSEMSYALIGSNLTNDVTVTAPTGYQVSLTSGSGFASSVVATQISGSVNATIYVKFAPTAEQAYTGNITNESAGATTQNVAVTGTGVVAGTPTITTSLSSVDFGDVQVDSTSVQSYTIEGSNLTDDITITVTGSGFEISEDGITFGTSNIVLSQNSGTVAQKTIYVKFSPDAVQVFTGVISNASTGATQVDVALSGNGVQPTIAVTPVNLDFSDVEVGATAELSYVLTASNLVENVEITAPAGYEVSEQSGAGFASSISVEPINGSVNMPIYVKFSPITETSYTGNISNESTGATTQNVAISGNGVAVGTSVITANTANLDFGEVALDSSVVLTYTILGSNLTDNIEISLQNGVDFTISDDNNTFGTSLTLSQIGGIISQTTIYVKFAPTGRADYSDTIFNVCTGATSRAIALTGSTPTVKISDVNETQISVYPNPSNGIFNVKTSSNDVSNIYIYDMSGKIIYSNILNTDVNTIDISNQANGLYLIKVQTNDEIIIKKVIKD